MPQIEVRMRESIAKFLPCAIETAVVSYQNFSQEEATAVENLDAKAFKAHHDACKVAIAHIELLIKLARWADLPDPHLEDENHQKTLQSIIESAQGELNKN